MPLSPADLAVDRVDPGGPDVKDDAFVRRHRSSTCRPAVRIAQLVRAQETEIRRRERIEQELQVAQLIQQQFLPRELPALPGWHVAAYYKPARAVGGDFHDFVELPRGQVGIVVGDVTDKREASTPTQLRQLRTGRIDVAVMGVGPDLPAYDLEGLRRDLVFDGDLLLAVPADHRFAERRRVLAAELVDEPWIVGKGLRGDPQFGAWPTLEHPRIAYAAREWSTRFGVVAAGIGIAVLPDLAAASVPGGVRTVSVDDPAWLGRTTVAVTVRDRPPEVAATVDALRREAARLRAAP